jgi:hypothetical protein
LLLFIIFLGEIGKNRWNIEPHPPPFCRRRHRVVCYMKLSGILRRLRTFCIRLADNSTGIRQNWKQSQSTHQRSKWRHFIYTRRHGDVTSSRPWRHFTLNEMKKIKCWTHFASTSSRAQNTHAHLQYSLFNHFSISLKNTPKKMLSSFALIQHNITIYCSVEHGIHLLQFAFFTHTTPVSTWSMDHFIQIFSHETLQVCTDS